MRRKWGEVEVDRYEARQRPDVAYAFLRAVSPFVATSPSATCRTTPPCRLWAMSRPLEFGPSEVARASRRAASASGPTLPAGLAGGNRVDCPVKIQVRRFSRLSQHVLHLGPMVEKAAPRA